MKNVLYYLGKKPASGSDIDGGSILAKQLIDSLKNCCNLDLAFYLNEDYKFIDTAVRKVSYYINPKNNLSKFHSRINQCNFNRQALMNYDEYDVIVVQHISLLFGTECFENEFFSKIILFPMFMTQSYLISGEEVPKEYYEKEKEILKRIKCIITPSIFEKKEIQTILGQSNIDIHVIPRGISKEIRFMPMMEVGKRIKIVNIGSIKKQKNQLESLYILNEIVQQGIDVYFTMISTNQDDDYLKTLMDYISNHGLKERVTIKNSLSPKEVAKELLDATINISTSKWETFGRGIYEGVCAGKPTFVLSCLKEVKEFVGESKAIVFCDTWHEMVNNISEFINNYHYEISYRLNDIIALSRKVDYDHESIVLRRSILGLECDF